MALGVVLLGSELALTATRLLFPRVDYQLSPPWDRVKVADPVLGYRPSPYFEQHDAWGFRNPAVPERADVIAIGDSMTFGYSASPEEAWPRQLAARAQATVYQLAFGGYGACEYQELLQQGLTLQPRVGLVGTYVANDISDCFKAVYVQARFPDLRSTDPAVLAEIAEADRAGTLPDVLYRELGWSTEPPPFSLGGWIAEHSALYGLLREVANALRGGGHKSPYREGEQPSDRFEVAAQRHHAFVYDAVPELRTCFLAPRALGLGVDLDDPRIREGLRIYRECMLRIRDRARAAGVELAVVVIPGKHVVYRARIRAAEAAHGPRAGSADMARTIEQELRMTAELQAFFRAAGIACVDTTAALEAAITRGDKIFPESDDEHPNGDGYGVIADAVLPELLARSKSALSKSQR